MLAFPDYSIGKKLRWMSMLASGAALLVSSLAFLAYEWITFRDAIVRRLATQAQIVGSNSVSALLFKDQRAAEETLAALKVEPGIVAAGIYTRDGRLFASYWRDTKSQMFRAPEFPAGGANAHRFEQQQLLLFRQIAFDGEPIGTVYIRSDLQEMAARLKRYGGIVVFVMLVSFLVALVISARFQRAISGPLLHLADTARIVSREKNYSVRATTAGGRDEVGLLVETFNEMLSQIQERDAALQQARDELERRVAERTAELAASNKELEAFTYSVSHDLRAPLRHIDGFSQLLLEQHSAELPEEGQRFVSRIRDGTRQMGQLVDDLLNLARVGRKELSRQVTGLNSLVEQVVAEMKRESASRSIEWKVQPLPFVECDPALMKQVFANLLSNAVKYTRPRERAVIEVGARNQNGQPVIFVRDNGVGFSMKYADKLFGVFQRLHRPEDFEGTGVGLATVQRIIHKHGGRVWAEAELNRGATFYFALGPAPAASRADEVDYADGPKRDSVGRR